MEEIHRVLCQYDVDVTSAYMQMPDNYDSNIYVGSRKPKLIMLNVSIWAINAGYKVKVYENLLMICDINIYFDTNINVL